MNMSDEELTVIEVEEGVVSSLAVEEEMRRLVDEGYRQVSRKFRHVARLPDGMTGLEALRSVDPDLHDRMMQRMEEEAADHFRRVHASEQGLWLTLTTEEFDAFRRAATGRIS